MSANGNLVRMEGKQFGSLTVLRRAGSSKIRKGSNGGLALWLCRCTCGEEIVARGDHLRRGAKKSCGINDHHYKLPINECAAGEKKIWHGMLQRCYNENTPAFKYYGAKKIRVAKRWHRFENFLSDMGPCPSKKHSLDRFPDMRGNYEPTNVRWATPHQQGENREATIFIEVGGVRKSLAAHTKEIGLNNRMVRKRLQRGWSLEEAVGVPANTLHRGRNTYPAEWLNGEAFKKP